jgi:CubicO group peptidase (beta-lactamase class C family)
MENFHRLASVSKCFTREAVHVLVKQKKLRYEDFVFKIMPEYRAEGYLADITVQHCINHSIGIWPSHVKCPMFNYHKL